MGLAEMFGQLILDHLLLVGGTIVLLLVFRRLVPQAFTSWRRRLAILYPIVIATAGAFCGLTTFAVPAEKVVVGLIVGWAASMIFQLAKPLLRRFLKKTFAFTDDELAKANGIIERHVNETAGKVEGYDR